MSKLVIHYVSIAARVCGATEDVIPSYDNRAGTPGFARSRLIAFHNKVPDRFPCLRDHISVGINQNRSKAGIVIVILDVQQQDAGVRSNRDLDFIRHFQSAAALEILFCDKDLNVSL